MPNVAPPRYVIPVAYRVDQEFVDALDELRRVAAARGSDIPTRAELVRQAVLEMRDRARRGRESRK